jgi:hypothetical protein
MSTPVLQRSPLSLLSTTEELRERKSSGSGLENRDYGSRDPARWPRGTLYPKKLALTSLTSGGSSVGTVRSRTKATEFSFRSFFTRIALEWTASDNSHSNVLFSQPAKYQSTIDFTFN